MARKKIGKENRTTRSVRIEPRKLKTISKRHKKFQTWIDLKIDEELKTKQKTRPKINNKKKIKLANQILTWIDRNS